MASLASSLVDYGCHDYILRQVALDFLSTALDSRRHHRSRHPSVQRISHMKQVLLRFLTVFLALGLAMGTALAEDKATIQKERAEVRQMRTQALAAIYKQKPELKAKVAAAPGYAVFTDYGITIFFVGGAGGHGIAVNNRTKKETFMNMGQASAGLGLGVKDVRLLLIFKTRKAFDYFVDKGWEFGGGGAAAAAVDDKGASAAAGADFGDQVEKYGVAKNGLMFETTLTGTKYWKSSDLN
jgi:lipid-binding SYLF domain-containing protein